MLNNSSLRIDWDPLNRKEVEEAKTYYLQARKEGRKILDSEGKEIERFNPSLLGFCIQDTELKEAQFAVRVFDKTGDRRLIWDSRDPQQIQEASELFQEYLTKGWKAYGVDSEGNKSRRIREFDTATQELLFDDSGKTTRELLSDFVKNFKEVKMLPRTFPG